MKYLLIIFILALSNSIFAQSLSYELDKIRKIKMLESTRGDVKKVLRGYVSDDEEGDEPNSSQTFSYEKIDVEISYTSGVCSDDADDTDEWSVAKGRVKSIEISFDAPVKFEDLQYDASDFQKEQRFADNEDDFVYHDKEKGIVFSVNEDGIYMIRLFPVKKQKLSLCKNEEAEELKEFYATESYFGNTKLEDRVPISCRVAEVTDLTLSASQIVIGCGGENKSCSNSDEKISVITTAVDPENDVLTYGYTVSGGEITGSGSKVVWNLWSVQPGTYTITAGVDDGCGFCGRSVTKTVVVKQCPDCSVK